MDETKAARSLLENRYGSGILRDALQHLQRPVINVALKTRPMFMINNAIAQPTDHSVLLATFGMKFRNTVRLTRRLDPPDTVSLIQFICQRTEGNEERET